MRTGVGLGLTNIFELRAVRAVNFRGRASLRSLELGSVDGIRSVSNDIRAALAFALRSAVAKAGTCRSHWAIDASVNIWGAICAKFGSFE